jgi:hypothetical protein
LTLQRREADLRRRACREEILNADNDGTWLNSLSGNSGRVIANENRNRGSCRDAQQFY